MAFNSKSINFKAGLDTKGVATGVQRIEGHMGKLSNSISGIRRSFGNIQTAIVGAFAVNELKNFAIDAVTLAASAEGVRSAFIRLNDQDLLKDLRRATKGTVDDLKLMQLSVKASNFKIPLEQLSTYLAFAQQRARETGESVDYLVDSIITGLGRQSVMILDNLGVSASELKGKMESGISMADALGEVIKESMGNKGSTAFVTAADKMDIVKAKIENLKIEIGQKLVSAIDVLTGAFDRLAGGSIEYSQETVARINQLKREVGAVESVQGQYDLLTTRINDYLLNIKAIKDSHKFGPFGEKRRNQVKMYNDLIKEARDLQLMLVQQPTPDAPPPPKPKEEDPLSLQEQISIAKKSNKAISELESQGLSKAQVQALDTAFAINVMNDNLSQIPETLATIDSGLTGKPPLSEFQKGIEEMTENVRSMLEGLVTTIAVDFFGAIGEAMVAGGDSFKSFGQQTLEAMGRFFKQIGAMFISYGIAALEFFKTLLVPANAPALIAAGVALSLIGGAISGAAKNMAQTGQPSGAGVPAQSGGMGYNFETRIDGYDLVLVNDRNQRLRNRRG